LADGGGLSELLLTGRLRELAAARTLLLWLWGPLGMAWGSSPSSSSEASGLAGAGTGDWDNSGSGQAQGGASSTAITLRDRTAQGVWLAIRQRLDQAAEVGLRNNSGHLLAFEGLAPQHRRDLLLAHVARKMPEHS
jgi:hypothetical protein